MISSRSVENAWARHAKYTSAFRSTEPVPTGLAILALLLSPHRAECSGFVLRRRLKQPSTPREDAMPCAHKGFRAPESSTQMWLRVCVYVSMLSQARLGQECCRSRQLLHCLCALISWVQNKTEQKFPELNLLTYVCLATLVVKTSERWSLNVCVGCCIGRPLASPSRVSYTYSCYGR